MKKLLILTTVSACVCATVHANALKELVFTTVMPAKQSPVIDGDLGDACWKDGIPNSVYYEYIRPNPKHVDMKTSCTILYDQKGLYFGIVNHEDHPELIRRGTVKNGQMAIHNEDIAELYIDPEAKGIGFYRWAINANGKYKASWQMDSANLHQDWNYSGVVCAAKVYKDHWDIEFFVPWAAFHGRSAAQAGDVWTFNHNRYRFRWGEETKLEPNCLASSAPMASYLTPGNFGYLYFSDGAKPDAKKVLALLEKKAKGFWAIQIGDTTYKHDQNGTVVFPETIYSYMDRQAKAEILENALYRTNIIQLASMTNKAEKIDLPLAGSYDFREPPKDANGFCGWYRHNFPKNNYVTKYLPWGNKASEPGFWSKLAGGGDSAALPKVMFMTDFGAGIRRALDYGQRFGVDAIFFPGNFGATGTYQDPLSHGGFLDKQCQFETLLAENPQAIFMSGFGWNDKANKYCYEVLRRVRDEGMGLVLIGWNGSIGNAFRNLPIDTVARRQIASASPYLEMTGLMVPTRRRPYVQLTEAEIRPVRYGKGRVVMMDGVRFMGWTLDWESSWEGLFVSWRAALDWALGVERKVKLDFESGAERAIYPATSKYVSFRATTEVGNAKVTARLRSAANEVLVKREYDLSRGENSFALSIGDEIPGGEYYLDVFAEVGGVQDAAAIRPFTKESYFKNLTLNSTNRIVIAENKAGNVMVRWDCNGLATKGKLKWKLFDSPYMQLRRQGEIAIKPWQRDQGIALPAEQFPTLAGVMDVSIEAEDGRQLARTRKLIYFPNHRFEDYTLISWSTMDCYGTPPAELYPTLVGEFGYRNQLGGINGGWLSIFNCRSVPYASRVCLGNGKYGPVWGAPRITNKKFDDLTKEIGGWSPYNPAAQKEMEAGFAKVVEKTAPFGNCVWSFGDECGFGRDLGFGGATDAKDFAAFLKKKYGTVQRYNQAHKTNITDFAQAEHAHFDEACKRHDWPLWFDTVQFSEQMYADTYNLLAKIVKKQDPLGRCGAEGSDAGDLELTVKDMKFWGPYRSLVEDELLRNVAPNHVRGIWWGGYLSKSPRDGFPVQQWEYLLTGTVNADQWFTVAPGQTESGISGDLDLAPYVKLYINHLKDLRRGPAQLMIRTPMRPDPIAIYYSHPSRSISSRDDEFASPMDSLADLIYFCYRHGFEVKMVTPRTLEKLKGVKALFLAGDTALGDREIAAFKALKKNGGIIASDVDNVGVLDEFLARREKLPMAGEYKLFQNYKNDAEMLAFLAEKGIVPREAVTGLKGEDTILRARQLGDMQVIGVKTHTKNRFNEVTLDFKTEGYVYEVCKGFVGKVSKVEMKPIGIPFRLFSIFPNEQSAPEFSLPASMMPGETASYVTAGLRNGGVYRLEVIDPSGKALAHREELFVVNHKTEKARKLQFPYNDAPGVWTVKLMDVATGLTTEVKVNVK